MRDKWQLHLNIAHLFTLSLRFPPPLLLPIPPSAGGPSSSSCHYKRAPVNQSFLIQWHVGRGHVTYVKRREWGDLQGFLVCEQVYAYTCTCVCLYDCRVEGGCQRVWCGREAAGDRSCGDTWGLGPTLSNPLVTRGTEGEQRGQSRAQEG